MTPFATFTFPQLLISVQDCDCETTAHCDLRRHPARPIRALPFATSGGYASQAGDQVRVLRTAGGAVAGRAVRAAAGVEPSISAEAGSGPVAELVPARGGARTEGAAVSR